MTEVVSLHPMPEKRKILVSVKEKDRKVIPPDIIVTLELQYLKCFSAYGPRIIFSRGEETCAFAHGVHVREYFFRGTSRLTASLGVSLNEREGECTFRVFICSDHGEREGPPKWISWTVPETSLFWREKYQTDSAGILSGWLSSKVEETKKVVHVAEYLARKNRNAAKVVIDVDNVISPNTLWYQNEEKDLKIQVHFQFLPGNSDRHICFASLGFQNSAGEKFLHAQCLYVLGYDEIRTCQERGVVNLSLEKGERNREYFVFTAEIFRGNYSASRIKVKFIAPCGEITPFIFME